MKVSRQFYNRQRIKSIQSQQINRLTNFRNQFVSERDIIQDKYFRRIDNDEIRALQTVMANPPDDTMVRFESLVAGSEVGSYDEFKTIHRTALGYFGTLPHQLSLDWMEAGGNQKKFRACEAYKRFQSLRTFIKAFLAKDLEWKNRKGTQSLVEDRVRAEYSGQWTLNKREFNYLDLSAGEKTLFAYAMLFFLLDQNPQLNIRESIILVDEPELHLHPDAEIDLINGLRTAVGEKGQLFIATHSLNILSALRYEEIFSESEVSRVQPA